MCRIRWVLSDSVVAAAVQCDACGSNEEKEEEGTPVRMVKLNRSPARWMICRVRALIGWDTLSWMLLRLGCILRGGLEGRTAEFLGVDNARDRNGLGWNPEGRRDCL